MKVVLLAGGTGGAKLAHGLQLVLPPGDLTVIVNVADDTERFGLLVCPDLDTMLYTLAGLSDREQGWGVAKDTYSALESAELVVIGPSNPIVSIGPILAVPGLREALLASPGRRIGVSGIVGGKA